MPLHNKIYNPSLQGSKKVLQVRYLQLWYSGRTMGIQHFAHLIE
jgi:hypothetical protein